MKLGGLRCGPIFLCSPGRPRQDSLWEEVYGTAKRKPWSAHRAVALVWLLAAFAYACCWCRRAHKKDVPDADLWSLPPGRAVSLSGVCCGSQSHWLLESFGTSLATARVIGLRAPCPTNAHLVSAGHPDRCQALSHPCDEIPSGEHGPKSQDNPGGPRKGQRGRHMVYPSARGHQPGRQPA